MAGQALIGGCGFSREIGVNASEYRFQWSNVLPFLVANLDPFYQHGSRAVPTFPALLTQMAAAANAAGK